VKRTHMLLGLLGVILTGVLFWLLLWQPKNEAIAATSEEIVSVQDQQRMLEVELTRLRLVREEAPEAEARLAAAAAIVPERSALPSLLRQLQLAADEASVTMTSVTVGRPLEDAVGGPVGGAASLPVTATVEGSYFQLVDLLRRVEAPDITPRGVLWESVSVVDGEYPELTATLTGRTFAAAVLPPAEAEPLPEDGEADAGEADVTEPETDPEVNVAAEVGP
jgi:Tfp pilus assembly protein PilO